MKGRQACYQCRLGKKRCNRLPAGEACIRCLQSHLQCSYSQKIKTQQQLLPSERHAVDRQLSVPVVTLPHEIMRELVEHYLLYIHDRPHSLFHRSTLRKEVASKSVNQGLLYAICSYGCRFHEDPDIRTLGTQLTAEAKRLLNPEIENVSLETIHTSILVGNLSASELNSTSEAIYCGVATRVALIMRIHTPDHSDSAIRSEMKLRAWWSLYMSDRWCSTRLGLPRMISDSEPLTPLPIEEHTFQNLRTDQEIMLTERKPGLWAYMITLVNIYGPIQDVNRRLAQDALTQGDLDRLVPELSQRLDSWEERLPSNLKMTESNIDSHRRKGLGGPFMALHLGYHYYSTLLYFQFLDSQDSAHNIFYANRCKEHASRYSTVLRAARQLKGCEAVYATVGQMAMVSSAVLLYTLLFGNEDELLDARTSLSSNFESLMELKKYWPISLGKMIERLFTFQSICLVSANQHSTHKLDRWMVRFLLEHSLPLDDNMRTNRMSPTPSELAALSIEEQLFTERGRMTNSALSELLN